MIWWNFFRRWDVHAFFCVCVMEHIEIVIRKSTSSSRLPHRSLRRRASSPKMKLIYTRSLRLPYHISKCVMTTRAASSTQLRWSEFSCCVYRNEKYLKIIIIISLSNTRRSFFFIFLTSLQIVHKMCLLIQYSSARLCPSVRRACDMMFLGSIERGLKMRIWCESTKKSPTFFLSLSPRCSFITFHRRRHRRRCASFCFLLKSFVFWLLSGRVETFA